jgi:hypothetical protein
MPQDFILFFEVDLIGDEDLVSGGGRSLAPETKSLRNNEIGEGETL